MTKPKRESQPEQERVTLARQEGGEWFVVTDGTTLHAAYEVRTFTPEPSTPGEGRLREALEDRRSREAD